MDRLDEPILSFGESEITGLGILKLIVLPILVIVIAGLVRRMMRKALGKSKRLDTGVTNAITSITYYVMLFVGFAWVLDNAGISMGALAVFSGAFGLGLGIGMQDIARNFVSGLIMLISRPVRPGDRLEIEGLEGDVESIETYSTKVLTVQDAMVIVPNSDILNSRLVNWTHNAARRMYLLEVGVHYDSDIDKVIEVLYEAAERCPDIMSTPPPEVFLMEFGDSSINFEIAVWTSTQVFRPRRLKSLYNIEVVKLFKENDVTIPYPQRDVHLIPPKE